MTEENRRKIISNDYMNLFIEPNIHNIQYAESVNGVINRINDRDAVIYLPIDEAKENPVDHRYPALPRLFGLLEADKNQNVPPDLSNLEAMKVDKIQNVPSFDLYGQGVLLGFIDTGIEYTNPLFKYADNTTRIISIWDQSIENMQASEDIFYYGTEYTKDQINLALQNETPLSVVPTTDEIGHGTTIAGLTGGSNIEEFRGVVPLAEFVIVKLKPAKTTFEHLYPMPSDTICYQEDDIMFGLQYLFNTARRLDRPIAICIALGTNQGSHDGLNTLNLMISDLASRRGVAIIIATGNENLAGHHYFGMAELDGRSNEYKKTVALRVAENEKNFTMEFWGKAPAVYSIGIRSPSGAMLDRIPASLSRSTRKFLFENTTVVVENYNADPFSGDPLILVCFDKPAPGYWYFDVYARGGNGSITEGFHAWLPMSGFLKGSTQLSELTEIEEKNMETTLTSPSDTHNSITVTAYDHQSNSIFSSAGRGNTRNKDIKPDFAAPGVSIYCPTIGNNFEYKTGSSLAAAQATGVAAMVLQWGIVKNNQSFMNCNDIKKFLQRGLQKSENRNYPNVEWGYGILDIYKSFSS